MNRHNVSVESIDGSELWIQITDNFDGANDADWATLDIDRAIVLRDELIAAVEQMQALAAKPEKPE